jgi:hypothetical protein
VLGPRVVVADGAFCSRFDRLLARLPSRSLAPRLDFDTRLEMVLVPDGLALSPCNVGSENTFRFVRTFWPDASVLAGRIAPDS